MTNLQVKDNSTGQSIIIHVPIGSVKQTKNLCSNIYPLLHLHDSLKSALCFDKLATRW